MAYSVAEILNLMKEKRLLDAKGKVLATDVSSKFEMCVKDFLKQVEATEPPKFPLFEKLLERLTAHVRGLMSGLELNVFGLNLAEASLSRELLSLDRRLSFESTALYSNFSDVMFMQISSQALLKNSRQLSYIDHLLPSAAHNYRRTTLADLGQQYRQGFIRVEKKRAVGGYNDIFNIDLTVIYNCLLDMFCLLVDIGNNTRIYFEEVSVDILLNDAEQASQETSFTFDNFAAGSTRKLKSCYVKKSIKATKVQISITSKQLAALKSENQRVPVKKLESIAAAGDLFQRKWLSRAANIRLNPFYFLLPLRLHDIPFHTVQSLDQRLVLVFKQQRVALRRTHREKTKSPAVRCPTLECLKHLPSLNLIEKSALLRNYLVAVEALPRKVIFKEPIAEPYRKLDLLFDPAQDCPPVCHLVFYFAASNSDYLSIELTLSKKEEFEALFSLRASSAAFVEELDPRDLLEVFDMLQVDPVTPLSRPKE